MNRAGGMAGVMLALSGLASLLFCAMHLLSYLPTETRTLLCAMDWMEACSMLAVCVCLGGTMASGLAHNVGLRAASPWIRGVLLVWGIYTCVLLGVAATHRVPGRVWFLDGRYHLQTESLDTPSGQSWTELTGERLQAYSRYECYRLRAWSALCLAGVGYASAFYLSCRRSTAGQTTTRGQGGEKPSGPPPPPADPPGRGTAQS